MFGAAAKAVSALRANKSSGVRTLKDSSIPEAHPDGGADQSDAPKDGAHADGTLRGMRVPKDMVSQRDAGMLAKAAEDVFRNSPIDNWVVDANIALAKLKALLGRDLSADLEEKFMAYVKAQQENAQWRRELEENLRKLGSLDNLPAGDDHDVANVLLDVSQMGLDLAGILDPTPASDGTSTLISFWRGEWLDAGISVVSMIPYLGDLAKLGKLGKYPEKITRAIQLALKSEKAAELLRPLLKQLDKLLQRIPLDKLPERLRGPLESVKKQLDNFFHRADAPSSFKGATDYSSIPDPKNVVQPTKPTPRQVSEMKRLNREKNGGILRDDVTGEIMSDSAKSSKGVTPPSNEAQVDHIIPSSKGGTRSSSNLHLRTRANNRAKSDTLPGDL